jgi:hypothetical protein
VIMFISARPRLAPQPSLCIQNIRSVEVLIIIVGGVGWGPCHKVRCFSGY